MTYLNTAMDTTEKSTVYTDEMGWWELPKRCDCGRPLHLTSGGDIPFCPLCTKKRELAQHARAVYVQAIMNLGRKKAEDIAQEEATSEDARLSGYGAFSAGLPL